MRIALPVFAGKVSPHFGHPDFFAFFEADTESKTLGPRIQVDSPPHQPGLLPSWLAEQGVNVVLAGGMGNRAVELLEEHGITVVLGCPEGTPEDVAQAWLDGTLSASGNACDH